MYSFITKITDSLSNYSIQNLANLTHLLRYEIPKNETNSRHIRYLASYCQSSRVNIYENIELKNVGTTSKRNVWVGRQKQICSTTFLIWSFLMQMTVCKSVKIERFLCKSQKRLLNKGFNTDAFKSEKKITKNNFREEKMQKSETCLEN